MIRQFDSFVFIMLTHCSLLTSCDDSRTVQYLPLTSSGRSPVCALDRPTSTLPARSKIHCASECAKQLCCPVHQMNDATKQCQLFNFLPSNYSESTDHCTAVYRNDPSPPGAVEADRCSFPFTYKGILYHTCAINSSTTPCYAWCPLHITGVPAVCGVPSYGFVAQNVTINVTIPTSPAAYNGPLRSVNGWLTVMSRVDGNWPVRLYAAYKAGFGDINSNFWLGLDNIYTLTNNQINGGYNYRVRFEFMKPDGTWLSEEYATFSLGSPASKYVLTVSATGMGDGGDALNDPYSPANNKPFDTTSVCASINGFFWYTNYGSCCFARWFGSNTVTVTGVVWYNNLQTFRMMIMQVN